MREKKENDGCIFCDASASSADQENLVVYRGELSFVVLNRYPYTSGHLMIAPYVHVSRLRQTSKETSEDIMNVIRRAEEILESVYGPDGLNVGINLGEAAGAGIEQHIHVHILPRWKGDANFMTTVSNTRVIPESLNDTYAKLKKEFARISAL